MNARDTVRQKIDRSRPPAHIEMRDDFERRGVDGENFPVGFARHVKNLAVGPDSRPFRLLMHRDDFFHFAAGDVEHTGGANVFIGDEQPRAVGADGKLFRVRTRREVCRL